MYMHTHSQTSAAKAPDSKVGRISASSTHRRPFLKTGDSCANSVVRGHIVPSDSGGLLRELSIMKVYKEWFSVV